MRMSIKPYLKHLWVFCLMLCVGQVSSAEPKAPPLRASYQAEQVSASTWVIHGPLANPTPENQGFMNNPAFIVGDGGVIVIDAGGTVQVGDMVLQQISQVTDLPVVATFATHIHGDHWLANQAIADTYPDAVHYAHPLMIQQAREGEGQAWVDLLHSLTEGASAGTRFLTPDRETDEGQNLTIAGKTFSIYHDPVAHTDTDIAIRFNEESVLFLGDTVMNRRLGRLDDGNFKGLQAFLERMLELEVAVYVPGHGRSGDRQIVEKFQRLVETIYTTAAEEYENGLSDFEIKPLVLEKLGDNIDWVDLDESLGKFVSLAYLEAEEDAF